MSTQRRRVLVNSGLKDGVYIEGLEGKAYTVDDWQGGNDANSIIVASGDVKFRMALMEKTFGAAISSASDPLENYMTAISDSTAAMADYDGAGNTANILKVIPSFMYAAGYCDAFIFPDDKTKGFLPSLGQLNLVYQNNTAVKDALSACGGTPMSSSAWYWSSTFGGVSSSERCFWSLKLVLGNCYLCESYVDNKVRPFANIS